MMNITEAEAFFYGFENHFWDLGLDNLKAFMKKLGNPENKCKVIHVAGTNGKGSVSAFIAEILSAAGYRVGRYHSPVVFEKRENIVINGVKIPDGEFARMVARMEEPLKEAAAEGKLPTIFEMETALAYTYFADKNCDFCVVECGLGGATDATNITESTILSVFTSISMDHTAFLGNTLAEIAGCKAGIIKEKVPAVMLTQCPEVQDAIAAKAEEMNSELLVADKKQMLSGEAVLGRQSFTYQGKTYELRANGLYQQENALLAIAAVRELVRQGYEIPEEVVGTGLRNMSVPGRFEVLKHENPVVIIDGAHNPDAALRLRENVQALLKGYNKVFVIGVFSDKEYKKVVENTCDLADNIYTVKAEGARGLEAEQLAQCIQECGYEAEAFVSVKDALESAIETARRLSAANRRKSAVVCFGSLSYLKYVKQEVMAYEN